jgi:hypothetical protein
MPEMEEFLFRHFTLILYGGFRVKFEISHLNTYLNVNFYILVVRPDNG